MAYQESFFFGRSNSAKETRDLPFKQDLMGEAICSGIFLGTSSWKFRGWEGTIYSSVYESQMEFEKNCLREYADLFPIVSLDATYYDWPREAYMRKLLNQVPSSFRFCVKVTNELTMPKFPMHPRFGALAGKQNTEFLNAAAFLQKFWDPIGFMQDRVATVVLAFSKGGLSADGAQERLTLFLEAIPSEIPLYVEVRDRELWNEEFIELIRRHGHQMALHSYTNLPSIAWQWKRLRAAGLVAKAPILLRALLPSHREKTASMDWMAPYDQTLEPQEDFHRDLSEISAEIVAAKGVGFFIFGNCLEGSAPQSVGRFLKTYKPVAY